MAMQLTIYQMREIECKSNFFYDNDLYLHFHGEKLICAINQLRKIKTNKFIQPTDILTEVEIRFVLASLLYKT